MKLNKAIWIAGVAVVAVVAAGGYYWSTQRSAGNTTDFAVSTTPAGITLQALGKAQGYGEATHLQFNAPTEIAYTNEKGMTLYTYDKDREPGKSSCTADCAKTWIPAAAPANAKPTGNWTLVNRDDGTKQWAFNGKPMYSYSKDVDVGGSAGNPAGASEAMGYGRRGGGGAKASIPAEWHVAMYQTGNVPVTGIQIPYGVAIQEVSDAMGVALVDAKGKTLYAFDGEVDRDKPVCAADAACVSHWSPLAAPRLAHAIGDWKTVERSDGFKQWTYKDKPLYTFDGDLETGDVNGVDVDKKFHVALIERMYMPSNIVLRQTAARGKIFATPDGRTLYRRDGFAFFVGGHQLYRTIPIRPAVGRSIGAKGCDAECQKTWHPYKAPADAQPNGYWDVVTRDDGSKQWTYKGFALWTYDGDKKPGDITGNDIYDLVISTDPNAINKVEAPMAGPAGLYWSLATPG